MARQLVRPSNWPGRLVGRGVLLAFLASCSLPPAPLVDRAAAVPGARDGERTLTIEVDVRLAAAGRKVQFSSGPGAVRNDVAHLVVGVFDAGGTTAPSLGYLYAGNAGTSLSAAALTGSADSSSAWMASGTGPIKSKIGSIIGVDWSSISSDMRRYLVRDYLTGTDWGTGVTRAKFTNLPLALADGLHTYAVFAAAYDGNSPGGTYTPNLLGYSEAKLFDGTDYLPAANTASIVLVGNLQLEVKLGEGLLDSTETLTQSPAFTAYTPLVDPAFSVTVTDAAGTAIDAAPVEVLKTSDHSVVTTCTTDWSGKCSAIPPPGTYDVQVRPAGYFPSLRFAYLSGTSMAFALQSSGEVWRDDFSAAGTPPSGWSASYGATTLTSNGNVMLFRSIVPSGMDYDGITKNLGVTINNGTHPYLTVRNKFVQALDDGGAPQFTFDLNGGWNNRIQLIPSDTQSWPWRETTVQNLTWSSPNTAFLIQDRGAGGSAINVESYFDYFMIHSVDRGYIVGTVRDASGTAISGARVQLQKSGRAIAEGLTDSIGAYRIGGAAGTGYSVVASSAGRTATVTSITVAGRTDTTADVSL